ncbi:MAG: hypothetical protein AUI15_36605 [Actinobacteria bacterium 13_2_20CM_2_66_6]|nr:MAG: hypothetical protein AUI15_36605 [Actinobacteria bacterium 13_2_20CM_2_66_6]
MIAFVRSHLTKVYGVLQTAWASFTAVLAVIAADPQLSLIVSPKTFAYLSIVNAVLGMLTLKRGFTNTRTLNAS